MEDHWILYHEAHSLLPFATACFIAGCLILAAARHKH
jgi:hypothetical protein